MACNAVMRLVSVCVRFCATSLVLLFFDLAFIGAAVSSFWSCYGMSPNSDGFAPLARGSRFTRKTLILIGQTTRAAYILIAFILTIVQFATVDNDVFSVIAMVSCLLRPTRRELLFISQGVWFFGLVFSILMGTLIARQLHLLLPSFAASYRFARLLNLVAQHFAHFLSSFPFLALPNLPPT